MRDHVRADRDGKNQVLRAKVEKWQNDLDSGTHNVAEWQARLNTQHGAGTVRLEMEA